MSFNKKLKEFLTGSSKEGESSENLESIYLLVKKLVADGIGRPTICKAFDLSERQARKLIDRAKEELAEKPSHRYHEQDRSKSRVEIPEKSERSRRPNKLDEIRGLLDQEYDSWEIAKLKQTSPATTRRLINQAKGEYKPAEKWVLKAAHKGIALSELESFLDIRGEKRAKQVLQDVFPGCFVLTEELRNGDLFLIPVHSSRNEIEELKCDNGNDKSFEYFVSDNEDYMCIKLDDDIPGDTIEIYNISDIHHGAKGHREGLFDEYIKLIQERPNAFAIIGGDLGEFLTKTSVGHEMDAYLDNTQQIMGIPKKLKPIAHKILDWVYSNHDDGRSEKTFQARMGRVMAGILGVPFFEKGVMQGVVIDLEWRGIRKTLFHTHEYHRAFEESKILLEIKKLRGYSNYSVDAYFSGHTHKSFIRREEIDNKVIGRGLEAGCYWVLNSGSTLARTGTYAKKAGYGPTPQDITFYVFDDMGRDGASSIPVHSL